ncbi:MAG: hypothetical protein Q9183_006568 [Haloplaca sp. 2 TL-2023]
MHFHPTPEGVQRLQETEEDALRIGPVDFTAANTAKLEDSYEYARALFSHLYAATPRGGARTPKTPRELDDYYARPGPNATSPTDHRGKDIETLEQEPEKDVEDLKLHIAQENTAMFDESMSAEKGMALRKLRGFAASRVLLEKPQDNGLSVGDQISQSHHRRYLCQSEKLFLSATVPISSLYIAVAISTIPATSDTLQLLSAAMPRKKEAAKKHATGVKQSIRDACRNSEKKRSVEQGHFLTSPDCWLRSNA